MTPSREANIEDPGYEDELQENEDRIQDQINNLLNSLSSRGKGRYFCPCGINCKKGGVEADGTLKLFERNSAFKSVLLNLCGYVNGNGLWAI